MDGHTRPPLAAPTSVCCVTLLTVTVTVRLPPPVPLAAAAGEAATGGPRQREIALQLDNVTRRHEGESKGWATNNEQQNWCIARGLRRG